MFKGCKKRAGCMTSFLGPVQRKMMSYWVKNKIMDKRAVEL